MIVLNRSIMLWFILICCMELKFMQILLIVTLTLFSKLNNKILRILQKSSRLTPTIRHLNLNYNIKKNYCTLQISDLHKFQIYCLVHKFIYDREKLPPVYMNYFTFNYSIHDHFTRRSNELHKSVSNKIFGFNHTKEKGARLWNNKTILLYCFRWLFLFYPESIQYSW